MTTVLTPDTTDETTLVLRRALLAPRDKVFRALTQPTALRQWFGPGMQIDQVDCDLRVGGAWRIAMTSDEGNPHVVGGRYVEITPSERLVYTWAWQSWEDRETLVTFRLADEGGHTAMTLTHERFDSSKTRDMHNGGWTKTLDRFERFVTSTADA